jgi:hypothetical protein
MRAIVLAPLLLLVVSSTCLSSTLPVTYTLKILGAGMGLGINNRGQVTGCLPNGEYCLAFFYDGTTVPGAPGSPFFWANLGSLHCVTEML